MVGFCTYDRASGTILMYGSGPMDTVLLQDTDTIGVSLLEEVVPVPGALYYVVNGEVKERPPSPIRRNGMRFAKIPPGATMTVAARPEVPLRPDQPLDGTRYDLTDSVVELVIGVPGAYLVEFECFPFQAVRFEVNIR